METSSQRVREGALCLELRPTRRESPGLRSGWPWEELGKVCCEQSMDQRWGGTWMQACRRSKPLRRELTQPDLYV